MKLSWHFATKTPLNTKLILSHILALRGNCFKPQGQKRASQVSLGTNVRLFFWSVWPPTHVCQEPSSIKIVGDQLSWKTLWRQRGI